MSGRRQDRGRSRSALERLARAACALYPRDFREQLADEMSRLFDREVRRVAATRGQLAAAWYATGTWLGILAGTLPARFQSLSPPSLHVDALRQDIRYAARTLVKSPGFAIVAALSLALGVGANTAIFSVVNAVLLQGLPYPDSDRLVILYERNEELGVDRAGASGPAFLDWRQRADSFTEMALFQPASAVITDLPEPEQIPVMRVTVNFLDLLGYEPARGRGFRTDEDRGDRHDVALVTDGFWRRAYGEDPEALGHELMVDHVPYTLTGVLPEDYWFPVAADAFLPWDEAELAELSRYGRYLPVMARLAPGVSLEEAAAEMHAIAQQLAAEHPEAAGWSVLVSRAHDEATSTLRPALLVLLGAVGFVLLIACANVANLTLARGARRRQELAVRAATGANRLRLLRQLLTESMLLAGLGGVLGLVLGFLGLEALRMVIPSQIPIPGSEGTVIVPEIALDRTVLAFTAGIALLTGLISGIIPAWQVSLVRLTETLAQQERSHAGRSRTRDALVTAEVALAAVLLVATVLMLQTFHNLGRVDPGFDPEGLLTLQIEIPTESRYPTDEEQVLFYSRVLQEMRAIPGVETVGISEILPLDSAERRIDFVREDADVAPDFQGIGVDYNSASAGFFEAARIPLLQGRLFRPDEGRDRPRVVVVDSTFASAYFPDESPLGHRIIAWGRPLEIVGVVGAIRSDGLDRRPEPTIYLHYRQFPDEMMSFTLRTRGDPAEVTRAAKEAVWEVDPEQPLFNVRPMPSVVASATGPRRATLLLLGVFGTVALLMAALGVYGVMSYAVGLRARELGLRKALGADAGDLLRRVVGQGLLIAGVGVGIGVITAALLGRALSSLLYGVSAAQPSALLAVTLLLLAVAAAATYVPARRAARMDPSVALRGE